MIVCDRYAVYLFIDDSRRQLCLAHVLRDFIALGERGGAPRCLGRELTRQLAGVFATLNAPGRDPGELAALAADTREARDSISHLLARSIRGRDPKTSRFCVPACSSTRPRCGRSPAYPACRPPTTPASERSGTQ